MMNEHCCRVGVNEQMNKKNEDQIGRGVKARAATEWRPEEGLDSPDRTCVRYIYIYIYVYKIPRSSVQ